MYSLPYQSKITQGEQTISTCRGRGAGKESRFAEEPPTVAWPHWAGHLHSRTSPEKSLREHPPHLRAITATVRASESIPSISEEGGNAAPGLGNSQYHLSHLGEVQAEKQRALYPAKGCCFGWFTITGFYLTGMRKTVKCFITRGS